MPIPEPITWLEIGVTMVRSGHVQNLVVRIQTGNRNCSEQRELIGYTQVTEEVQKLS